MTLADRSATKITRLEAARRQLETGCVLYFEEGDPVSIHTLAAAAHDIVRALKMKVHDAPPTTREMLMKRIVPGFEEKVQKKITEAQRYFKHAGTMGDSIVFDQRQNELLLFDTARMYRRLATDLPDDAALFMLWFAIQHHTWFKDVDFRARLERSKAALGTQTAEEFYRDAMGPNRAKLQTAIDWLAFRGNAATR